MQKIFKYPLLEIQDKQEIDMHRGAKIISAQIQNGILCLWAIVDHDQPKEKRTIVVIGTGNPTHLDLKRRGTFIGTVQFYGGSLVFHVFDYFTGMMGV